MRSLEKLQMGSQGGGGKGDAGTQLFSSIQWLWICFLPPVLEKFGRFGFSGTFRSFSPKKMKQLHLRLAGQVSERRKETIARLGKIISVSLFLESSPSCKTDISSLTASKDVGQLSWVKEERKSLDFMGSESPKSH